MNARLNVREIASRAWEIIVSGEPHEWIRKRHPGGRVNLKIGAAIPDTQEGYPVPKQTLTGRRRRFTDAMIELAPPGWCWDSGYARREQ